MLMERDTDVRDLLRPHVPRTELYESYLLDEVSVAKNELISMRFFRPVLERHDTRLQNILFHYNIKQKVSNSECLVVRRLIKSRIDDGKF